MAKGLEKRIENRCCPILFRELFFVTVGIVLREIGITRICSVLQIHTAALHLQKQMYDQLSDAKGLGKLQEANNFSRKLRSQTTRINSVVISAI